MTSNETPALTPPSVCASCLNDDIPAAFIAHAPKTDGTKMAWPVCNYHVTFAMCAGWFPIDDLPALTDEGGKE